MESAAKEPTVVAKPTAAARRVAKAPVQVKKSVVVTKRSFKDVVDNLVKSMEVYGPRSRQGKFVYDRITSADDLALDFDITPLPPKVYLFPARETILKFKFGEPGKAEPVVDAAPRAIVGVHPCDIYAIGLLDEAFISNNPDPDYIARRQNTIIIGVDDLNPSPKSFAPSMGTHVVENGFDLMLTDIGSRYMVLVGSKKGADLLTKYAQVAEPTAEDIARQKAVHDEALRWRAREFPGCSKKATTTRTGRCEAVPA
jgi:hypothetical protein